MVTDSQWWAARESILEKGGPLLPAYRAVNSIFVLVPL